MNARPETIDVPSGLPHTIEPPSHPSRLRHWGSRLMALLVALIAGAGFWFALSGKPNPAGKIDQVSGEAPVVAVTLAPVTFQEVERSIVVVGSLFGREEFGVVPEVEGRIVSLKKDIGDTVRSGELLAEIDPVMYQLAIAEAERALEAELTRIGLTELPQGDFDVNQLPNVVRAAAQLRNALARFERAKRLRSQEATSIEELQVAETEYDFAKADHRQSVLNAETILAAAKHRAATLATAQKRLDDTRVIAPWSGDGEEVEYVVVSRKVAPGQMVYAMAGMSTTLYELAVMDPLEFRASVPEKHFAKLRVGQTVELRVDAYPDVPFEGRIHRIRPAVDRANRTFEIEALVTNTDRRLAPGSFAKGRIVTEIESRMPSVPEEAIISFAGVTKVFVVRDNVARQVRVSVEHDVRQKPGDSRGRPSDSVWIAVQGELNEGDMVITSGHGQLADGVAIRTREPHASASNELGSFHTPVEL